MLGLSNWPTCDSRQVTLFMSCHCHRAAPPIGLPCIPSLYKATYYLCPPYVCICTDCDRQRDLCITGATLEPLSCPWSEEALLSFCIPSKPFIAAGQSATPGLYPVFLLAVGQAVAWMPDNTKTGAKDGPMELTVKAGPYCCLTQLHLCLDAHSTAGHPVVNFLTRPLARNKSSFKEEGMTSADLNMSFKQHLLAAGVYRGQTVHGTRRGSMQHAVHVAGRDIQHKLSCSSGAELIYP
jgi:hypothetical protein